VIEFNARFGDPETQCLLLRLESDLLPLCLATAEQKLSEIPPLRWSSEISLFVVAAAPGYPTAPETGVPIEGNLQLTGGARVFFSGVKEAGGKMLTGGGRVLGVGALGKTREEAAQKVYGVLEKIHWNGIHYRKDIGIIREEK
jgi:phosphoribosylamine--glycine ligase